MNQLPVKATLLLVHESLTASRINCVALSEPASYLGIDHTVNPWLSPFLPKEIRVVSVER